MRVRRTSIIFGISYAILIVIVGVVHPEAVPWRPIPICAAVGGFLAGFIDAALTDLVRRRR